jgi:uroporphyrinogen decarboxylase
MNQFRTDIKDRLYRVYAYQPVDRVPDIEFGYWPQTIRRWLKEGMPVALTDDEQKQMFPRKLDDFFGFEHEGHGIQLRSRMNPEFDETILERRPNSVIMVDKMGVTAERFQHDQDESSIPHYIRFPIEKPEDWPAMKDRYRFDDPWRAHPVAEMDAARAAMVAGKAIHLGLCGFYGQLRYCMGTENLSYAFFDMPALIHEMVEHWAEINVRQINRLPADIRIDFVSWWEDMAGRNGPLCSPAQFREFLQPGYRAVMTAVRKRGCALSHVDCDGNPGVIVGNWLEEGVNVMFPIEVEAGADAFEWRRRFGKELRLRGGIGKQPLVEGGAAIDRELERIRPLFEQGGYIPHLDHLVPPDIPYRHYCEYLEKKRRLIGK